MAGWWVWFGPGLVAWLHELFGWLAGWLVGWLADWLVGLLAGWLAGLLFRDGWVCESHVFIC